MPTRQIMITFAVPGVLLSACGGGSEEESQPPANPENQGKVPPPAEINRPSLDSLAVELHQSRRPLPYRLHRRQAPQHPFQRLLPRHPQAHW